MRLYLDTCVLSRLFDAPSGERVERETAAVAQLFDIGFVWLVSPVLAQEIGAIPEVSTRSALLELMVGADERVTPTDQIRTRARTLNALGFGENDAAHLAAAESARADAFLTTDDRLQRRARQMGAALGVQVENPVEWVLRSFST